MGNLTQTQVALHHRSQSPLFSFSVFILYIMPFSLTRYAVNCSDWINLRFIKKMVRNPDQLVYNSAWLSFPFQNLFLSFSFWLHNLLLFPFWIQVTESVLFHPSLSLRWVKTFPFTGIQLPHSLSSFSTISVCSTARWVRGLFTICFSVWEGGKLKTAPIWKGTAKKQLSF